MTKIKTFPELTYELVREIFDYKDGWLYWKINKFSGSRVRIGEKAGYYHAGTNRNYIGFLGKHMKCARLIFLWHYDYMPKVVDHINRNSTDDKIENLREATIKQNSQNRGANKKSTSQYIGVSWYKRDRNWEVSITSDKKRHFLGRYKTEIEAALVYNKWAIKLFGEFACLNIIKHD